MGPPVLFPSLLLLLGITERSLCSDFDPRSAWAPSQPSTESISATDTKLAASATETTEGAKFYPPKQDFASTVPAKEPPSSTEVQRELEATSPEESPISENPAVEAASATTNSVDGKRTQATSHAGDNKDGKHPLIVDLGALQHLRLRRDDTQSSSTPDPDGFVEGDAAGQQEPAAQDPEDSENSQFQNGLVYLSDVDGDDIGETEDSVSYALEPPDQLESSETLAESTDAELREERDANSEIFKGVEQRHGRVLRDWYRGPSIRKRDLHGV
ncbi:uncharacterized protein LOC143374796 [Andrena cerasifolii]|uniref:uncharacterized protein LOC143374796 n=1 Tax=Andrena cerasifolii TaxID=2819439 RepID=UPI0040381A94